mmetsp:Transcript_14154/g.35101  ORF Transcript_14154/g.35101 Transcript_14154/m.35101 type:complete len:276 (-) Transcript_14154:404-1231(-)
MFSLASSSRIFICVSKCCSTDFTCGAADLPFSSRSSSSIIDWLSSLNVFPYRRYKFATSASKFTTCGWFSPSSATYCFSAYSKGPNTPCSGKSHRLTSSDSRNCFRCLIARCDLFAKSSRSFSEPLSSKSASFLISRIAYEFAAIRSFSLYSVCSSASRFPRMLSYLPQHSSRSYTGISNCRTTVSMALRMYIVTDSRTASRCASIVLSKNLCSSVSIASTLIEWYFSSRRRIAGWSKFKHRVYRRRASPIMDILRFSFSVKIAASPSASFPRFT